MSFTFYRSRVRQNFHRLPTLGIPMAIIFSWLAMDVAVLLRWDFDFAPDILEPKRMMYIPLFIGLGAIGRDASDGLLPLFLTRPITRSAYVLSHWAALGTVASLWCLLHLLGQWSIVQLASHSMNPLQFHELFFNAFGRIALCFGMAAPLVCFSARLPSFGNVVLWVVLFFVAESVLPGFGKDPSVLKFTFTVRQYLEGLLLPELDFRKTFAAAPISWFRIATYLSNVSLMLLLAVYIFNRREVSYASR